MCVGSGLIRPQLSDPRPERAFQRNLTCYICRLAGATVESIETVPKLGCQSRFYRNSVLSSWMGTLLSHGPSASAAKRGADAMNESNFELVANTFANSTRDEFCSNSLKVSKERLENLDRRRDRMHPTFRKGSYVYVAYENQTVLYVGETGEHVRTRFKGDGSGEHRRKDWYCRMTHVRFWELPSKTGHYRKFIEAALIFALRPSEQPNKNSC